MKLVKQTLTNIRRTPYQSAAAVTIMLITLTLCLFIAGLLYAANQALTYFETRPQITAYFEDKASVEQIQALRTQLSQSGLATKTTYFSKDQALEFYRSEYQADPLLLEMVTADILPASLEISTDSLDKIPQIAQILKTNSAVEDVIYQEDVVANLNRWIQILRRGGLTVVVTLLITSLVVVTVVVGMKVAFKKNEIEIMSLLGASRWYIAKPYLLEGTFYGLLSGLLAFSFFLTTLILSTPSLASFFGEIPLFPIPPEIELIVLAVTIIIGITVGLLGSLFALKRYLK